MTFEPVHPIFWDFSDGDPWVLRYLRRYARRVRKMLKRIWSERIDQLGWMLAWAEPGPNDPEAQHPGVHPQRVTRPNW